MSVLNALRIGMPSLRIPWFYGTDTVWIHRFVALHVLTGLVWGSAIFLMPAHSFELEVPALVMGGGLVTGSIPMVAVIPGAHTLFLIAVMSPLIVGIAAVNDLKHVVLAAITFLFCLSTWRSGRLMTRTFMENFQARIEDGRRANRDGLTGIANRHDQRRESEWSMARRGGYPVSIILIDIDDFKRYNDTQGHLAGDACLRRIAGALSGSLPRHTDLIARYGGEEFVALLPATDTEGAERIATERLNAIRFEAIPQSPDGDHHIVTASLGVATGMASADGTALELIDRADQALYLAKKTGKNRFVPAAATAIPGVEPKLGAP